MRVTDKEIMNIIQERGVLRFSTLMLRFHISSVQALQIVEEYKKKGIIDDKCRAASGVKTAWKNPYAHGIRRLQARRRCRPASELL